MLQAYTWYSMDFRSLLLHIIGQHVDTSERTGQQPPHVNESLSSQQPSQASGASGAVLHVAAPIMQNQPSSPVSPVAASKFGKQICDHLGCVLVCPIYVHVTTHIHVHTQNHSLDPRTCPCMFSRDQGAWGWFYKPLILPSFRFLED